MYPEPEEAPGNPRVRMLVTTGCSILERALAEVLTMLSSQACAFLGGL